MRPTFEIELSAPGAEVLDQLSAQLGESGGPYVGQVLPRHAFLQLPRAQRTLLSPYLNLEFDDSGDRPLLRGRFSPHPNVWTGFMAVYGVLAMLGVAGLMYGLAQLTLGESSWTLAAAPVSAAAIAFVYGASVIGQGLTADEMYGMRAFIDRAVLAANEPTRPRP